MNGTRMPSIPEKVRVKARVKEEAEERSGKVRVETRQWIRNGALGRAVVLKVKDEEKEKEKEKDADEGVVVGAAEVRAQSRGNRGSRPSRGSRTPRKEMRRVCVISNEMGKNAHTARTVGTHMIYRSSTATVASRRTFEMEARAMERGGANLRMMIRGTRPRWA